MTSNHGLMRQPVYNVKFLAEGSDTTVEGDASVCSINFNAVPYVGLVGRHFLQYGRLVLDGPQEESAFHYRFPVA